MSKSIQVKDRSATYLLRVKSILRSGHGPTLVSNYKMPYCLSGCSSQIYSSRDSRAGVSIIIIISILKRKKYTWSVRFLGRQSLTFNFLQKKRKSSDFVVPFEWNLEFSNSKLIVTWKAETWNSCSNYSHSRLNNLFFDIISEFFYLQWFFLFLKAYFEHF